MNLNHLNKIQIEEMTLRKVELSDKQFIKELFKEIDIANNYVVAEDIKKNYENLVGLWLIMNAQNEGLAWKYHMMNYKNKLKIIEIEYLQNIQKYAGLCRRD